MSGKGIPAALILSSLKTLFRTTARDTVDPAAIAERISAALFEEHAGQPYATAIVARFEATPRRVAYLNAGHPAGSLLRSGAVSATLESGGQPLGLLAGAKYRDGRGASSAQGTSACWSRTASRRRSKAGRRR